MGVYPARAGKVGMIPNQLCKPRKYNQWKLVSFAILSGPSAFQKVIRKMFENLPECTSILDDILCWGSLGLID
jgi:hypothetical protein